jgi:hypothetical protein
MASCFFVHDICSNFPPILCHLKILVHDHLEFVRDIILVVCYQITNLTSCAFQNTDNASLQRGMLKQCDFFIGGHFFSFAFNSDRQVYSQMGQVHITSFREREKSRQFAAQWKNSVISVAGSSLLAACPTVFYDIEWKTVALIPLRAQAKLQTLKNRGTHKI